ncbi:ATP-binding protein [Hydrogenophaga intermedia]|uniref:ATP-binding protein n=1 Tax=Hydrogenophaga intermedia TaxID=65786 RepID=UPI00204447CB|nr:ATP-binding protein [Hydrogenophaga intermedia]MCM3562667.1 ATP-binding protein [Hydrogenophaga intermedia]
MPPATIEQGLTQDMIGGLRRRLLITLLATIALIGAFSVLFHYQSAGTAALQQDQRLQRLVPMLADSVVVSRIAGRAAPGLAEPDAVLQAPTQADDLALLMAPPVQEFLADREGYAAVGVFNGEGQQLVGPTWLPTLLPTTDAPEFISVVEGGVTHRVVAQRMRTEAGELIFMLADGSDARQRWVRNVLLRVLLPNLLLFAVAAVVLSWGISRALQPLIELKQAVERRSPRDLSPIDDRQTPAEVRPLVAALNRLFARVNEQSETQRRFVADAAHQLRTPLAGLQAQVEAWAQATRSMGAGDLLSLRAEQVLRLRDATRNTTQLANQLLALSRTDALRDDESALEQIDLAELCESLLAKFLDAASVRHIDLGLEVAPAQTRGHTWLLRELLINLVDNAIKYTPAHGHVTLRCGQHASTGSAQAWIEVEDDGPGIAPAERERVLQRFYRVPGSPAGGHGLGLAIADGIARAHRTQLQFDEGAQGRGLRVRVVFDAVAH